MQVEEKQYMGICNGAFIRLIECPYMYKYLGNLKSNIGIA